MSINPKKLRHSPPSRHRHPRRRPTQKRHRPPSQMPASANRKHHPPALKPHLIQLLNFRPRISIPRAPCPQNPPMLRIHIPRFTPPTSPVTTLPVGRKADRRWMNLYRNHAAFIFRNAQAVSHAQRPTNPTFINNRRDRAPPTLLRASAIPRAPPASPAISLPKSAAHFPHPPVSAHPPRPTAFSLLPTRQSAPPAPQRPINLHGLRRQRPVQILRRRQLFAQLARIKFRRMPLRHSVEQLRIQFVLPRRILAFPRDHRRRHRRQIPLQLLNPR